MHKPMCINVPALVLLLMVLAPFLPTLDVIIDVLVFVNIDMAKGYAQSGEQR